MCAFVFTKSMVIGVKSFICTYFLHEPNNCEKCQQLLYFSVNNFFSRYIEFIGGSASRQEVAGSVCENQTHDFSRNDLLMYPFPVVRAAGFELRQSGLSDTKIFGNRRQRLAVIVSIHGFGELGFAYTFHHITL